MYSLKGFYGAAPSSRTALPSPRERVSGKNRERKGRKRREKKEGEAAVVGGGVYKSRHIIVTHQP